MSHTQSTGKNLREVLDLFMQAGERPTKATLQQFVGDYPQYAGELTDLASEWLLLDVQPQGHGFSGGDPQPALVASAMDRVRNRLAELKPKKEPTSRPVSLQNPFEGFAPKRLKEIGSNLNLDTTLMAKLKNRLIQEKSIPSPLINKLAVELGVFIDTLTAWLKAPPRLPAASFKAEDKPELSRKEDFQDAVQRSTLNQQQKGKWLD